MPLTRSFRETVQARARRDVKFRRALIAEAVQALLAGNLDEGRAALSSCINAFTPVEGGVRIISFREGQPTRGSL